MNTGTKLSPTYVQNLNMCSPLWFKNVLFLVQYDNCPLFRQNFHHWFVLDYPVLRKWARSSWNVSQSTEYSHSAFAGNTIIVQWSAWFRKYRNSCNCSKNGSPKSATEYQWSNILANDMIFQKLLPTQASDVTSVKSIKRFCYRSRYRPNLFKKMILKSKAPNLSKDELHRKLPPKAFRRYAKELLQQWYQNC